MIDGGANVNMTANDKARECGEVAPAHIEVTGIVRDGPKVDVEEMISARIQFTRDGLYADMTGDSACMLAPGTRRNILCEGWLKKHGIAACKLSLRLIWPDGRWTPLLEEQELYYIWADIVPIPSDGEASTATVSAHDQRLIWAARLGVNSEELMRAADASTGLNLGRMSKAAAELIDNDEFRKRQTSRRKPAGRTPVNRKATRPGERFICDGFGKHSAPAPGDGAVYQMHAVDQYTDFGYEKRVRTHESEDWVVFLTHVILHARSLGHDPTYLRFDQAPELTSDNFKERLEEKLSVIVEFAGRQWHEGIGSAENNNDVLTRRAEAAMQRVQWGTALLLPARGYQQVILNLLPAHPHRESRFQRYTGRLPRMDGPIPYLFGTKVLVHEAKETRGPKGSLDKPRATAGRLVGLDEGQGNYVVLKSTGGLMSTRHVTPIDEWALMRRGIASGAATEDTATQTDDSRAPDRPPTPTPPTQKKAAPLARVDVGTRVAVHWLPPKGGTTVEYEGIVTRVEGDGAAARHTIVYDGWDGDYIHCLHRTKRRWRVLSDKIAPERPTPDNTVRSEPPSPPPDGDAPNGNTPRAHNTRQRTSLQGAHEFVSLALEATTQGSLASVFDAAAYQYMGDAADQYACRMTDGIAECWTRRDGGNTCCKATQNVIDVSTPIGKKRYRIPSSKREVHESPEKDLWLTADRGALDAIIAAGNSLVPRSELEKRGIPIARTVTVRKLKVDPATGGLDEHSPFKSRHSVDGAHLARQLKQKDEREGKPHDPITATSNVIDELALKMLLAQAAEQDRNLTKGDVPNAYAKGIRNRPDGGMELPSTLRDMRGESDEELAILLRSPCWGEIPAGAEWELEFDKTIKEAGWRPCEGVPAMYYFNGANGASAVMATIVDDLIISETHGYSIAEATLAKLRQKFGEMKSQREPTAFAGYKISRDRERRALTISLPQKCVETARTHLPMLLEGVKPDTPKGKKLMDMADALMMAPREPGKPLTKEQVSVQQKIGSLKYIEKVQPKLSLAIHRLSCIMASPPPEAGIIADSLIETAYEDRYTGITYSAVATDESSPVQGRLCAHIPDEARVSGHKAVGITLDGSAAAALEASADATWGDRNIYGMLLTKAGGAVAHMTKKIGIVATSSMENEGIASGKAAELVEHARNIEHALGETPKKPTVILTDNSANLSVACKTASASRSKHFIRRYLALQRRVAEGAVVMVKIDDENMPADFLTKWVALKKLRKSVEYATNARAKVQDPEERSR